MILVCDVISHDRMTEGWNIIVGRTPSWQVTSLPSLVTIGTVVVGMFLVCHVTISLILCISCRCTCLPNLVIIRLIEMEISILISILTRLRWKKLNSPSRSVIYIYIYKG